MLHFTCVSFDSKLNRQIQVKKEITNSRKALHTRQLIHKYFSKHELLQIITSNYLSTLHCNAEVQLLLTLSHNSKCSLLASSASPLKLYTPSYDHSISYDRLHSINKRATPLQVTNYKMSILLHKTYKNVTCSKEFSDLFFKHNFNVCAEQAHFFDTGKFKVGTKQNNEQIHTTGQQNTICMAKTKIRPVQNQM